MTKIEGVVRLITPLHCAQPSAPAAFDENGRVLYGDGQKGKPVTVTMQMPLVTKEGVQNVPYFPANDLRGRLRRKAASRIMAHFVEQNTPIRDVTIYTGLTCGSSSASPENGTSIEEANRSREHVYMGLFGGGIRMLRSGYRAQDMVPVIEATLDCGMVPAKYASSDGEGNWTPMRHTKDGALTPAAGWNLLHVYQIHRVDDAMRVVRPDELGAVVQGGVDAVANYQAGVVAERGNKAENAKRSRVENMAAIQCIAAGTPMYLSLDLENYLSDAQIGLAILALDDLIQESKLGGFVRAGCGKIMPANLTVTHNGETFGLYEKDSTTLSEKAQRLADMAEAAIQKITVAEMEAFFEPSKPAKKAA